MFCVRCGRKENYKENLCVNCFEWVVIFSKETREMILKDIEKYKAMSDEE